MVRGRFAPSPSGALHLGNARTALLAWASVRQQGGVFVMRVEDIDTPRTVSSAVMGNLDELRWLGIDWDEGPDVGGPYGPYLQSQRSDHYQRALDTLGRQGRLAEDWLSRKDLTDAASAPHGATGPVYGAAERARSAAVATARTAAGRAPALRARLGEGFHDPPLMVHDRRLGSLRVDVEREVGDVVVQRSDGLWSYALAVVVDDAGMHISEVVRGNDLWPATGTQAALARLLNLPTPTYAHAPLLLDTSGERMAKRRGSHTLSALRLDGVPSERVVGALAFTLGWLPTPRPVRAQDLFNLADVQAWPSGNSRWTPELDAFLRGAC